MPRMIVVAGPPGGGKSTQLGADYFRLQQIPYFNIDDRCNVLHGSSKGIPLPIGNRANAELSQFCMDHFVAQMTFAYESTLRAPFAIEQSGLARAAAFQTELHFIAAPFAVHLKRVQALSQQGGHSASEKTLRSMYDASLNNLPGAVRVFDHTLLYDGSGAEPQLLIETHANVIQKYTGGIPDWMELGLRNARHPQRDREDFGR